MRTDNARRVAVVHDWLVTWGGAERVLEQILECYPGADVFALVEGLDRERRQMLNGRRVKTSFLQRLPGARNHFWYYAPLMPLAVEQFDLTSYDLVISSSHATALGAITGPDTVHVSYIYSPMRFAWDLQPLYLEAFGYGRGVRGAAARGVFHYLRLWDRSASNGVDRFIADSHFVARRIAKAYRRDAMVLHPPVDTQRFMPGTGRGGYFLTGSRMNPFKRIDVVVEAFRSLPDERLVVVGEGPHLKRVAELAGNNVELVGHLSDRELTERMQEATAFIHAAKEDFGIVMAEALACGTPVIAFGEGGATELVRDIGQSAPTGVLFDRQTPDSVADAVREFRAQQDRIDRSVCRSSVLHLGRERFREQFRDMVEFEWKRFHDTSARVTPP